MRWAFDTMGKNDTTRRHTKPDDELCFCPRCAVKTGSKLGQLSNYSRIWMALHRIKGLQEQLCQHFVLYRYASELARGRTCTRGIASIQAAKSWRRTARSRT